MTIREPVFKLKKASTVTQDFARGFAMFFGVFTLLNLLGDWRAPHIDANLWWIDLRSLPTGLVTAVLLVSAICLIRFAWGPPTGWWRTAVIGTVLFLALATLWNAGKFYSLLASESVHSNFPVPLSLWFCLGFAFILKAALKPMPVAASGASRGCAVTAFIGCLLLFPLGQMVSFGKTDYRRQADAVVVLGARAYSDGRPSNALADRVRTACALYKEGAVHTVIMSGEPGDGAFHETEVMRSLAIQLGVKPDDIILDKDGLSTQATVNHTSEMLAALRARRVLVVSHFYHLPRIKMAYQRSGVEVYTVPAEEPRLLRQLPYNLVRETAAFWAYFFRPLVGGRSVA